MVLVRILHTVFTRENGAQKVYRMATFAEGAVVLVQARGVQASTPFSHGKNGLYTDFTRGNGAQKVDKMAKFAEGAVVLIQAGGGRAATPFV